MKIPKEYMEIKDYLDGYMSMQKISAAFENKAMDKMYSTNLIEDDCYWIATLIEKIHNNHKYDSFKKICLYGIYMNKFRKHVYLKFTIKTTYDSSINNFLYESIFKKLHYESFNNLEIVTNELEDIQYEYNVKLINIRIDLSDSKDSKNYVEQINKVLNIVQLYNYKIYDKLIANYLKKMKVKRF